VNSQLAIINGGLADKSQFFGDNMAETVSGTERMNSWNDDYSDSVISTQAWQTRGMSSDLGRFAGALSHFHANGGATFQTSHRTILSGY
jgi:hypothetical protein